MSDRTATQAAIKRATFAAQRDMDKLDASVMDALQEIYKQAAVDISARIREHAGNNDNVALQELQSLLSQVNARLGALSEARDNMMDGRMVDAADLGLRPFTAAIASNPPTLSPIAAMRINEDALRFVHNFVAADGLQLSDRIWRIDRQARELVTGAIEQAVIQGHGAGQAARELLARGEQVPIDIQNKLAAAAAGKIERAATAALLTGPGAPVDNAMRLFRTELNRAHGEAYIKGALAHPDAAGLRFLLSPAHPKPDICDLYSRANLYGLGGGVYPDRESCPWPAHPNTLSYVEVVFKDEISDEDRAGKETAMQALQRLTPEQQRGVLGAHKHEAFKDGKLTQGMIKTPWSRARARIEKLPAKPSPIKPVTPKPRNMLLADMIAAGSGIADRLLVKAGSIENFLETLVKDLSAVRSLKTEAKIANGGKGAELVRAASRVFPDDWTRLADKHGALYTKFSTGRGYQITYGQEYAGRTVRARGFGVITFRGGEGFITAGRYSTAVHEYAHRLQHVLPELDGYFQDLHGQRTEGDPLRRLRDLFPGHRYATHEVTREDKYQNAYQGRIYSGRGHSYLGKYGALEVMTMAFEDVLGGNSTRLAGALQHDRDMLNLVIGLLYHYVP